MQQARTPSRRALTWTLVVLGVLLVAAGAWYWFAPKPTDAVDDAAPAGALVLRSGAFMDGAPGHTTSGTVALLRTENGFALRFEDYDATPGPAVYFYLTRMAGTSDAAEVEERGLRLTTSGAMGQASLRGSFNVALPDGVDAEEYAGVAAWCERFNVLFGSAPLA